MYEKLTDVPEPIREYYYEESVSEPTGEMVYEPFTTMDDNGEPFTSERLVAEYKEVLYVKRKPIPERKTIEQLDSLVQKNKPKLDVQAKLVANDEYWSFFGTYNAYLMALAEYQAAKETFEPFELEDGSFTEFTGTLPSEPVKPKFRTGSEILAPYQRELFKRERTERVGNIRVEVDGMVFDGDETSQLRMARAALVMEPEDTVTWVLANNDLVQLTKVQLVQALKLAGLAQTALWT